MRYPTAPEPTVRGNDVVFAGHAVVVSAVVGTMFFRGWWGFEQDDEGVGWGG